MVFADLKNDFAFRRIFATHPDILQTLLDDLLERTDEGAIVGIDYLPIERASLVAGGRLSILRVQCTARDGAVFVVEVQLVHLAGFLNRAVVAGCKPRVNQLEAGERSTRSVDIVVISLCEIVTSSREAAVLYKEKLDLMNGPASVVIYSGSHKDKEHLAQHHTTDEQRKDLIARFLRKDDPLKVLIVCDMLLTGFDAPVEQVMYLDAPLKEHRLLQAIARVNRTADKKTFGLVVDYWGVSEALAEALVIFAPADVVGVMSPKTDELPRLQARHAEVMRTFLTVKDKDDLNACVAMLEAEDVRAAFNGAFRRFSQSLDMLLPDPRALPYRDDARWLGKIRGVAGMRYRDSKLDISDCGEKVRKLIEEAVVAEGIQILVKQVSLFSPDFDERLEALGKPEAKASEMEHAIKDEIHVKLEDDPAFYSSLRERLEKIVLDRKAKRIDAAQQLALFAEVKKDMEGRARAAESLGLSPTALAMYGLLTGSAAGSAGAGVDPAKKELASLLEELIEEHVAMVDWAHKDDLLKQMRSRIKRQLRAASYAEERVEPLAEALVDLLKQRHGK